MRDQYMRCGEGFIICYSVIDRHSYEEASEYRKLIQRVRLTEDIPVVLIANKSDLESLRKVKLKLYYKNKKSLYEYRYVYITDHPSPITNQFNTFLNTFLFKNCQ